MCSLEKLHSSSQTSSFFTFRFLLLSLSVWNIRKNAFTLKCLSLVVKIFNNEEKDLVGFALKIYLNHSQNGQHGFFFYFKTFFKLKYMSSYLFTSVDYNCQFYWTGPLRLNIGWVWTRAHRWFLGLWARKIFWQRLLRTSWWSHFQKKLFSYLPLTVEYFVPSKTILIFWSAFQIKEFLLVRGRLWMTSRLSVGGGINDFVTTVLKPK